MTADPLAEVFELPVSERIRAVQAIWDSVAADAERVPVTEWQKAELERRLRGYRANPDQGASWDEVEARLRSRD